MVYEWRSANSRTTRASYVQNRRSPSLLEAKPAPDLVKLLGLQGIAVIWRHGDGFKDNARGKFV